MREGISCLETGLDNLQAIVFDFDGVLTDNRVYVDDNGREMVCCHRGDGLAFDILRQTPLLLSIVSTETNPVVARRAEKLQIGCIQGCGDKPAALRQIAEDTGVKLDRVLFVGNDLNDFRAMETCGFSACPSDSHPRILALATFPLKAAGGCGVVRELVEDVLHIDPLSGFQA